VSFTSLVLKNLLRQRVRAGLTLVGISLGITTIVALGVITAGFKQTAGAFVTTRGADFMVAQEGAADMSFSIIPEDRLHEIEAVPGVVDVRGALFHVTRAGSNPFFFVLGMRSADLAAATPELVEGRLFAEGADGEVVLGVNAANDLGVAVGEIVEIDDVPLRVVGTYRSNVLWEESGAFAPLPVVQRMANRGEAVSVAHVTIEPAASVAEVAGRIEDTVPGVVSIATADDIAKVDTGFQLMDAANIAISGLAIVIGGIGVMNTMVMSIFERTREIGVLRAVGWSGARVVRMIIIEALWLCVVAAFVGALLGVLATRAVMLAPAVSGVLEPSYEPRVFAQALVVAVVVALVGAAYPAFRAVRLTPMEALRYE
jgi:putative ABC transport system permease protein